MNPSHHFRATLALYCLILLPGCVNPPINPNQTAGFYSSCTTKFHPPKPGNYEIPILLYPPKREYEVIGRFTMRIKFHQAENGFVFMEDAARFNARRAGADAILIVERWQEHSHHYYATDDITGEPVREASAYVGFDAKMIVYK